ncbi:MAG: GntR family transcriptional regulator [Planctomycetaceae bacterium]|nr:GntR family transcriptional regulator [Planctomycetaceae bacterium]
MSKYKYMQIAERLRTEILASRSPGKKIPTEDELADHFSMSRNTVRQAVQMLVDQGFLVKIQGSGTFVTEKLDQAAVAKPARSRRGDGERGRCIAVVMNQFNAYIFPSVLMGISDYLLKHDYHMLIRMTFNQIAKEEEVLRELLDQDVAGFIIEPARSAFPVVNHDLYRRIRDDYPCVLIHAQMPSFGFPCIDNSNVEAMGLLVDHLVANGHRDIAMLMKADENSGQQRFLGVAEAMRRHGLKVDESRVLWYMDEDMEELFSDQNAHRVMQAIKGCTAVTCFNDYIGKRFLDFLPKQGIRVPEDLSVVGYDDMQGYMSTRLTTINHPKEAMGEAAARGILELIRNPDADVSVFFPPELVIRESVAPPQPAMRSAN